MLLATFCLRLACGLAGALLVLSPKQVAPRFYRVQFLIILGLVAGAGVLLWQPADYLLLGALTAAIFLAFFGSVTWMLEGSPGHFDPALLQVFRRCAPQFEKLFQELAD